MKFLLIVILFYNLYLLTKSYLCNMKYYKIRHDQCNHLNSKRRIQVNYLKSISIKKNELLLSMMSDQHSIENDDDVINRSSNQFDNIAKEIELVQKRIDDVTKEQKSVQVKIDKLMEQMENTKLSENDLKMLKKDKKILQQEKILLQQEKILLQQEKNSLIEDKRMSKQEKNILLEKQRGIKNIYNFDKYFVFLIYNMFYCIVNV